MAQTRLTTQLDDAGAPVRSQLVVVEGPDVGRAIALDGARVVGTSGDCDLVLSDERVSARHLEVRPDGGGFRVKDLASTNGTWLEGARVGEAEVTAGATLKVGRTFLRVQPQAQALEVVPSQARRFGDLVAESLAMREVFSVLELAARGDVTVLVTGETGTGKELVARAVHEKSARRGKPFVTVDCGALPESLLESELFGHVRGAFTGALSERRGAFQKADGGTLFLDELGAVSPSAQARLLRVLEARTVKPVGSDVERQVDVRVIAATPVDLATRVAAGQFRADLFYRLSVLALELPPLRARREDIPVVAAEVLRRRGFEPGPVKGPNLDRLMVHGWPGNVRELRNVLERALALSPGATSFGGLKLGLEPVAPGSDALPVRVDLPFKDAKDAVVDAFEEKYLRDVHVKHDGNVSAGARFAGVDRKHWRALLRKHGLLPDSGDEEG
ncbi:MAG: sigma 54-dependent Fis family transcriptional regulator [Myxococcales bacterium]|nr:sigma 54-dependent Fis family transcriptional regulator [Myxococcales bacterium]